jgi:hypothetical protein
MQRGLDFEILKLLKKNNTKKQYDAFK